jgi:hypothetical protein
VPISKSHTSSVATEAGYGGNKGESVDPPGGEPAAGAAKSTSARDSQDRTPQSRQERDTSQHLLCTCSVTRYAVRACMNAALPETGWDAVRGARDGPMLSDSRRLRDVSVLAEIHYSGRETEGAGSAVVDGDGRSREGHACASIGIVDSLTQV